MKLQLQSRRKYCSQEPQSFHFKIFCFIILSLHFLTVVFSCEAVVFVTFQTQDDNNEFIYDYSYDIAYHNYYNFYFTIS